MKKGISQTWFFKQAPNEVWDYLTKPELMEQWLMKSDFKPILGQKFRFMFTPKPDSKYEGEVNCEVLEINPFTRLSYSWNGGTPDNKRKFNSIVVWTLVPNDQGTELQLQHDGFELPEDILTHTNGWNHCLKRFEDHINSVVK